MKKNKSYAKDNLFYSLILPLIMLLMVSSTVWAEDFTWADYRAPFSDLITVCHNKSAAITVDLPKDFLQSHEKITLSVEVESRTNTLAQKRPGFEDFDCYISIKGSFFGTYRIPVKSYPKRQSQQIEIKSKHLKPGKNTLRAAFRWKNQNWSCKGSCCGYYIHQMYFPQVSPLQQSPVASKAPYIPLLDANVTKIRFFESGFDAIPRRERVYKNRFSSSNTRYIDWELNLEHPQQGRQVDFKIDAIWYRSDGSVLAKQTKKTYIKPNWTNSYHSRGWGSDSRSWWFPDTYKVEFYIKGEKVSSGTFEVFGLHPRPTEIPILRLETGMHTAALWSIDVDADSRYMVTGSNDKTVRLWDLSSYRLIKVLRPPIGRDWEGRISAVAISPDGKTIACGGSTGYSWDGTYSIYLFNRQSGKLIRRLTGFPGSIKHIVYSRDGKFLAAGHQKGLSVFEVPVYSLIGQDNNYDERCSSADFGPDGRLAAVSYDGFIRLYEVTDKGIRRIKKQKAPSKTTHFFDIKFSPDGSKIATAYIDQTRRYANMTPLDIFSGKDLKYLFSLDTSNIKRNIKPVAWSTDGRSLYAGGMPRAIDRKRIAPIFKWNGVKLEKRTALPAANFPIQGICPLKKGGIVFGAYNAEWGVFDDVGNKIFYQTPLLADFRGKINRKSFFISSDASKVRFSYELDNMSPALFSVRDMSLLFTPDSDEILYPPLFKLFGLNIKGLKKGQNIKVNEKKIKLSKGENINCHAIAPDGNSFLLGAEWNLYRFDRKGKRIWKIPVRSVARAVNISQNSRIAVVASDDGTIRWYRMQDGKEIIAFFSHRDRQQWIAWIPEGYYMSSPYGDDLIGWHINNGKDKEADFYTAKQFERILYRPDYVLAYFNSLGGQQKATQVLEDKAFDINNLASIAPPKVKIISPEYGSNNSSEEIMMKIAGEKRSLPMQNYTVFVNSIPVTPSAERVIAGEEQDAFTREVKIPLSDRENIIRVEVFNGTSMGLAETIVYKPGKLTKRAKGNLYLLSVGVNDFKNMPSNNLEYAAFDAENLAKFYNKEEGSLFNNVFVKVISDHSESKPFKEKILKDLDFIKKAKAEDTVIIFLASHGLSDPAGNFYFVPGDANVEDVKKLTEDSARGATGSMANLSSLISWEAFFDALRSVPGRRLLVVDTCQAKNIAGTLDIHSLAKRSATSSFALLAASQGNEESQEYPQGKQGLFTYALLKGLSGDGDSNADGRVILSELYDFISKFVERNRNTNIGKQTPQLTAPKELKDMVLTAH